MAQIFGDPAGLEPAAVPAALAPDRGDRDDRAAAGGTRRAANGHFQSTPDEREIGDAGDDRRGGEQEIGHHAAAIGVGQIGREAVGPGEAAQHLRLEPVDEGRVGAGQRARRRQQSARRSLGDRLGRLVMLDQAAEEAPRSCAAEHRSRSGDRRGSGGCCGGAIARNGSWPRSLLDDRTDGSSSCRSGRDCAGSAAAGAGPSRSSASGPSSNASRFGRRGVDPDHRRRHDRARARSYGACRRSSRAWPRPRSRPAGPICSIITRAADRGALRGEDRIGVDRRGRPDARSIVDEAARATCRPARPARTSGPARATSRIAVRPARRPRRRARPSRRSGPGIGLGRTRPLTAMLRSSPNGSGVDTSQPRASASSIAIRSAPWASSE